MSQRVLRTLTEGLVKGLPKEKIAETLGVSVEVLDSLVKTFEAANGGEGAFARVVTERRAQMQLVAADWDELEAIAVERLADAARSGRVSSVSDLLAIARISNMAARRGGFTKPPAEQGDGIRTGVTLRGGDSIELRLSATVVKQIQEPREVNTIEVDYERVDSPLELRQLVDAEAA